MTDVDGRWRRRLAAGAAGRGRRRGNLACRLRGRLRRRAQLRAARARHFLRRRQVARSGLLRRAHGVAYYLRAPTLYPQFLKDRRAFQYWVFNPELRTAIVALDGKDEFLLWSRASDENVAGDIAPADAGLHRHGCAAGNPGPQPVDIRRGAGGGPVRRRPRAARGRRGASVHADRRLRHEHRHRRRRQPGVEAGGDGAGLGRRATCSTPTRPSAGRSPSATPTRRAHFAKNVGDVPLPAEMEERRADRRGGAAPRRRVPLDLRRGVRLDRRAARRAL